MKALGAGARRPLAALVACAAAFLSAAPAPSDATARRSIAVGSGPGVRAPGDFRHARHVSLEWIERGADGKFSFPESPRDCAGCHRFASKDGVEVGTDPQDFCADCHYPAEKSGKATLALKSPKASWSALEAELRAPDGRPSPFNHPDHAAVACRECHAGEKGEEGFVADVMPIPRGTRWCVDCHDPTLPTKDARAFRGDAFGRFVADLNASPRMAHVDGFKHSEHYDPKGADVQGECDTCHNLAASTAATLAEREYEPGSCRVCHVPLDLAKPLVFDEPKREVQSRAALCFDHADHLTPRALADPVMKADRCFACHVDDGANYALKPGFGTYAACAECHDRVRADDARATAAGAPKASLPPAAKDHGTWDDPAQWGKCHLCHAFDGAGDAAAPPRSMKDNRPLAKAARPRAGLFRIATQKHPHVTSPDGAPVDGRCAQCHVVPLPEAPSKIVEARFSHATHVAANAPADGSACATCHLGPVGKTERSDDLGRTYEPAACRTCHLGAEPVEDPAAAPPPRTAPPADFNHRLHLGKKAQGKDRVMNCADCHAAIPEAGKGEIGVKPGAASCTDCHLHDAAHAAVTGGKDAEYVRGCVQCHAQTVPDRGKPLMTTRRDLVGLKQGVQAHEAKVGERCGSCHKRLETAPATLRFADVRVAATADPESPHRASAAAGGARFPAGVSCAECHWHNWTNYANGGELSPDLKGKKPRDVRADPSRGLNGYPGGARR